MTFGQNIRDHLIAAAPMVVSFSAPSFAQRNEAAALDAKVTELFRTAKYGEAIPLAQSALAIRERSSVRTIPLSPRR